MTSARATLALIAASLALSACAATGEKSQLAASVSAPGSGLTEAGYILNRLPDSSLPRGKCGMILWTLTDGSPAAVFRFVAGSEAEVSLQGALLKLSTVEVSGRSEFGVSERQVFETTEAVRVRTNFRFGLGFDGGVYLERALISIEDAAGWKSVSPAAGIAGCRR